jgi:hypothetical protein
VEGNDMRGLRNGAARVALAVVLAGGLGLVAIAATPAGASGATKMASQNQAATLIAGVSSGQGITVGHNAEGRLDLLGPAATIMKLCPPGDKLGFVCLFTGFSETGTGLALFVGDNVPATTCNDVPLPFVENVFNDTNESVTLGDGSCANMGPAFLVLGPGADQDVYPTDPWASG